MNILDHYKQSHDLRASEDYEVFINDQGAGLGTPAPVEGRFFYPEGDAPRPQYEGDMLERTGQALEDVGQTAKSMAVGAGAGMAGLPGDVVALTGGLARLLFPGDEGRIQGATDTITKISEAIGSERFLGLYRDLVNESDMSAEDKQMALDAAETGSFFSLPGAVPVAQAAKRGAKAFAAGAPARVAERQSGTTLASGVDPTAMIDDIITAQARYFETGKFEPPTAENPVSVVKPTEQEPGIIAFHGSGADFDEFRLEMIGTGEGAQAYGHGLYFTDSEDIAGFYKNMMTRSVDIDGKPYIRGNNINDELVDPDIADDLGATNGDLEAAIKSSEEFLQEMVQADNVQAIRSTSKELEKLKQLRGRITVNDKGGKTYKVGLAPKPDELLDYDTPLNQQPRVVQKQIENLVGDLLAGGPEHYDRFDYKALAAIRGESPTEGYSPTGDDILTDLQRFLETAPNQTLRATMDASQLLNDFGIPGLKYRAAGSRGAATADEAAERNYVIFDDKAVKILQKYGIVGPVAVTAGAASQTDTEANDGKTT